VSSLDRELADAVLARMAMADWFRAAMSTASLDRNELMTTFTRAWKLGRYPLAPSATAAAAIREAGGPERLDGWSLDHAGRVALLLKAVASAEASEHVAMVEDLFYRGETREKQAVLRALPFLPEPPRFVPLGVEACRTNSKEEFDSIATDNPFAADHFSDNHFNQMVLKAIFMGTPVARIVGLEKRATRDLSRMASDYAAERRAASREVPDDVGYVVRLAGRR
jgi:hypothetical protein